jgi:hypothetical protein
VAQTLLPIRTQFFEYLFGNTEGFLCIATSSKSKGYFSQKFFKWPDTIHEIDNFITSVQTNNNVWFCTSLLSRAERVKDACLPGAILWSDLDHVDHEKIDPPPTSVIESSPGRFQAYWRLVEKIPPDVQEDLSKRLAYHIGADRSGWDLTQLLRVPFTFNMKYPQPPKIQLLFARETLAPVDIFDALPDVSLPMAPDIDVDEMPEEPPDVSNVIYAHREELRKQSDFSQLYANEPQLEADWSRLLWRLINICIEVGMTREETFAVASTAACNKYERDNRPVSYLWREVIKADLSHNTLTVLTDQGYATLELPQLVDPDSVTEDSLVLDYKKWGEAATDAPIQYHELACFILLSATISGGLRLGTSFGELVPNLWGLILGESTLTRKTTAMRMAMDIITDLDKQIILATDGSPEGLLTGLSTRPQRVSIFYKDEVSGFFDSINRKDYLAGLPETLTQLYDVPKVLQRLLRKDTITITEPYFIFFGGGIRDKVYGLISEEYILSGFLPRFLVVSGENDLARLRRTGPPTAGTEALKQNIVNSLIDLKEQYSLTSFIEVGGEQLITPVRFNAKLDEKAWAYYGDLEMKLVHAANDSGSSMIALPTFQRLAFSMLKMAVLIAATRRETNEQNYTLEVTKDDIHQAAWYIQRWGVYTVELLENAGKPFIEKFLEKVGKFVRANPGCTKSAVMLKFHMSAKEARETLETLGERGIITVKKQGRMTKLYAVI